MSGIYGPDAVQRGGEGLGIAEAYPVSVYGAPNPEGEGCSSWGRWADLREAGFDRPAEQEPVIVDADGEEHEAFFFCLRDEMGKIVAVWDEGRWWTPRESAAWTAAMLNPAVKMMAEATHQIETENRAQRRRRRR